MNKPTGKAVVAIVGRPNVGKSTLFNRLSGQQKAIVIDEPGATRDRNYAACSWNEKSFLLVDTGGLEPTAKDDMRVQMRAQTELAIAEADVVIALFDGREGLQPADQDITARLRPAQKPVFFAVNKIDGPCYDDLIYEFHRLGMELIFPISAQHDRGIDELMDAVTASLNRVEAQDQEESAAVRITVVGKPNVGKSSLVNRILGFERTIVNPLPGTTRDPIDTALQLGGRDYILIDTAGIRRKSRITEALEEKYVLQALKSLRRSDVALLLVDAQEGVTEQDAKIAGLAVESGTAIVILFNKWDTVEKDEHTVGTYVAAIRERLKFLEFAPIMFVSAATGQRVLKIFPLIDELYEQYTRKVGTAELNRALPEFIAANPPPRLKHRENRFMYAAQAGIKPPSFVFFVREPQAVHFSYRRYLANQLRARFGLEKVPIRISLRKSS